jgi:hypothetical protein
MSFRRRKETLRKRRDPQDFQGGLILSDLKLIILVNRKLPISCDFPSRTEPGRR